MVGCDKVGESGKVVGIEHIDQLVTSSIENIRRIPRLASRLDDGRIRIIAGDGRRGYSVVAPYDAIHVGAAAPELPPAVSKRAILQYILLYIIFIIKSYSQYIGKKRKLKKHHIVHIYEIKN